MIVNEIPLTKNDKKVAEDAWTPMRYRLYARVREEGGH